MEDARDTLFRSRPVSVIQKNDWKLMLFYEEWMLDGGRAEITVNNAVELYKLAEDESEMINLANSNTEKRDELLDELLNWLNEVDAPLPHERNKDIHTGRT